MSSPIVLDAAGGAVVDVTSWSRGVRSTSICAGSLDMRQDNESAADDVTVNVYTRTLTH